MRAIAAIALIVTGTAGLYGLSFLPINELFQNIGIELFGAAVVAVLTWAIITPSKDATNARETLKLHQELFGFVSNRAADVKADLIDFFVLRIDTVASSYAGTKKAQAFKAYVDALKAFSNWVSDADPAYKAQNYRNKWNASNQPLHGLLRALHRPTSKKFVVDKATVKAGDGKGYLTSFNYAGDPIDLPA